MTSASKAAATLGRLGGKKKSPAKTKAARANAKKPRKTNGHLIDLLEQMLFAVENADETGYVTDVGFIDLDALHNKVRAAIADSRPPVK